MKNKKIISIVSVVILGALLYQVYFIYQIKKQVNLSLQQSSMAFQALNAMGTPDKDGVTGFDRLVAQTINKFSSQKK